MKQIALLTAMLLVILPLPAAADGPIGGAVYGRINLTLDRVDQDSPEPIDEWQLNSNASRVGLKGETAINEELSAIYQLEWEVNVDGDGSDLSARNRFLGLSGNFGTVLAGKHDTPTKMAQNDIDLFNDLAGDIKSTFEGENRANDIVMYQSPDVRGLSTALAFIPGEEEADQGAVDAADGDSLADGVSMAAHYSRKGVYLALAIDRDVDGQDLERLTGEFALADFTLGAMLQHNEDDAGTLDETGAFLSGAYVRGKNVFKAQVGKLENDVNDGEEETLSLGYDRKLGASTRAFAYATRNADTDDLGNETKDTVVGIGLEHKF